MAPPPPQLLIPLINKPFRRRLSWSTSDLHEPLPNDGAHEQIVETKSTAPSPGPSKWGQGAGVRVWGLVGKKGKEKEIVLDQRSASQVNVPLDQASLRGDSPMRSKNTYSDNRSRPTSPRIKLNPPCPLTYVYRQQPYPGPQNISAVNTAHPSLPVYQPSVRRNASVGQSKETHRETGNGFVLTDKPLPPLNIYPPSTASREDLPLYQPVSRRDIPVEFKENPWSHPPANRDQGTPTRPPAPPPSARNALYLQIPSSTNYHSPPHQGYAVRRDHSGQSVKVSPGSSSGASTPKLPPSRTANGINLSSVQSQPTIVQQSSPNSHPQNTHWFNRTRNKSTTNKPLPPVVIDVQPESEPDVPLYHPIVQPDLLGHPGPNGIHRSDTRGKSAQTHFTLTNIVPSTTLKISDDRELPRMRPCDTTSRLYEMRRLLMRCKLDYYIVPGEDSHGSHCVAPSDRRLEFMSGYTGSPGLAIIALNSAHLFTDSKDWVKAEEEIDHNWTLIKRGSDGKQQDWIDWIETRIESGSVIGIDARLISLENATLITTKIKDKCSKLVHPPQNLVDLIWAEKPKKSLEKVYVRDMESAGKDASNNLDKLKDWIRLQSRSTPLLEAIVTGSDSQRHVATLVTSLNYIGFLLNLHGSDTRRTICPAYLFVSLEKTYFFVEPENVQGEVIPYLNSIGVVQRRYKDLWTFLRQREWGEGKVFLAPQTPYAIPLMLTRTRYTLAPSYVQQMISMKNQLEIDSMRGAYLRGAVSFVRFLAWLEEKLAGGHDITQYEALSRDSGARYLDRKPDPVSLSDEEVGSPLDARSRRGLGGIAPTGNIVQENHLPQIADSPFQNVVVEDTDPLRPQYEPIISITGTVGVGSRSTDGTTAWKPTTSFTPMDLSTLDQPNSICETKEDSKRPISIEALDLARTNITTSTVTTGTTISRYSKASSRTESTDYGTFYTRRAYSEETLNIQ